MIKISLAFLQLFSILQMKEYFKKSIKLENYLKPMAFQLIQCGIIFHSVIFILLAEVSGIHLGT